MTSPLVRWAQDRLRPASGMNRPATGMVLTLCGAVLMIASFLVASSVSGPAETSTSGPDDGTQPNPPEVRGEGSGPVIIMGTMALVGLATTVVGLVISRKRNPTSAPAPGEYAGAIETTMRLAEDAGAWLQRTRHYLVGLAIMGVVLWFMVVRQLLADTHGIGDRLFLKVVLIVIITVLSGWWALEFRRVARDLRAWRTHIGGLRQAQDEVTRGPGE